MTGADTRRTIGRVMRPGGVEGPRIAADHRAMNAGSPTEGQVACSTSSVLLRRLRAAGGDAAVGEVLRRAGVGHSAGVSRGHRPTGSPTGDSIALFDAAAAVTRRRPGRPARGGGDRPPARRDPRRHAAAQPRLAAGGLRAALAGGREVLARSRELHPEHVGAGPRPSSRAARPGFRRDRHMCLLMLGHAQPADRALRPAAGAGRAPRVRAARRRALPLRGHLGRRAAPPTPPTREQLVVALESQLARDGRPAREHVRDRARPHRARRPRRRAAAHHRARRDRGPRARATCSPCAPAATSDLHVHHHGLADGDVDAEARELLDGDGADAWSRTRLVADVASRTRHYGRLMAASRRPARSSRTSATCSTSTRATPPRCSTATRAIAAAREREEQSRALLVARPVARRRDRLASEVTQRLTDDRARRRRLRSRERDAVGRRDAGARPARGQRPSPRRTRACEPIARDPPRRHAAASAAW